MKATKVVHIKETYGAGLIEVVIRNIPEPLPPSEHKYS